MSYYDVNASPADGCECVDDPSSASCSGATPLGNVAVGGSAMGSGRIPAVGGADWYTVTFTTEGTGAPRIAFTGAGNPGGVFRFDVFVGTCTNASTCTAPEAPSGLTTWNFSDSFSGTPRSIAWPSTVFIRVSRTGSSASCAGYVLQVTR